MQPNGITPRKALNKAYLKLKPVRSDIERFKQEMLRLLDGIRAGETEEYHKNLLSDFLKRTFYEPIHFINTRERYDLVIHTGNATSAVAVIIEAKSPTNKSEMPKGGNLDCKAMHELLLYYLQERVTNDNKQLTHLVITNVTEWFIFDAQIFEKIFAQDRKLLKQFGDFGQGRLVASNTDFFYREIASNAIKNADIPFTYFNLGEFETYLRNDISTDDKHLVPIFKILSPVHLLKLSFANDSNTLDRGFYTELLHIIGLQEVTDKGRKLIQRKPAGERNGGSLLENTIAQLDGIDKISRLPNPSQYGSAREDRLFNVALELVITWINRILFLKLLEAQLLRYHNGDKSFAFLNSERIREYDDLHHLFFNVLARRPDDRGDEDRRVFRNVPYLNSSLFEPTALEHDAMFINGLRDRLPLPLTPSTILKDVDGRRKRGEMPALDYLFGFLDAYDFASEGAEDIQEDNKTLINASVLGLIFEKINGYRDGSFFTPGFITMQMCRDAVRSAVLDKFNAAKGWGCTSLNQLYNRIEDKAEANTIFNDITICDPAVGSGHFLVSALNEMIAVKSDLKILQDRDGRTLRDYHIEVVNDELVVTDGEGRIFEYRPNNRESQRVQETLFNEKQAIIEHCLFGVDINANSVKICRLRLWIELLKSAYYYAPGELETLPNIDINIKHGNSVVSRFSLDEDLQPLFKKSKWTVDSYRIAVQAYRTAKTKDEKRYMQDLIDTIRSAAHAQIHENAPLIKRRSKLRDELTKLQTEMTFIALSEEQEARKGSQREKLQSELADVESKIESFEQNRIYEHAFEWRFEFPEVLDDDGTFVGFDVVIGNPPYIRQEELGEFKPYFKDHYATYSGTADLYVYFIERGLQLLKKGGHFLFIVPNKWMRAGYGKALRGALSGVRINSITDFGDLPVFEEATTYPCILHLSTSEPVATFPAVLVDTLTYPEGLGTYIRNRRIEVDSAGLDESGWMLTDSTTRKLLDKIKSRGVPLGEYVNGKIYRGVLTGLNEAFVIDSETRDRLISEDPKSAEIIKPFLAGRDIKRYQQPVAERWLIFTRRGIDIERYPAILKHLEQYKERLIPRPRDWSGKEWSGRKPGNYAWYEIQDAVDYWEEFEKSKIVLAEIAANNQFTYDDQGSMYDTTAYIIPIQSKFLLALCNSKLFLFSFSSISSSIRGNFYRWKKQYLEVMPICVNDRLESLIALKADEALIEADATRLKIIEDEIDQLVYELYGLTIEEIKIVEGL